MSSRSLSENKIVITDTSCFILLEKINAIGILNQLFSSVITTPEIVEEYGKPLPEWIVIQTAKQSLTEQYSNYVDIGEASAIALALEISCDYIIIDDMAARRLAVTLSLPVKGTIGILLLAKQKGIIPLLSPYIGLIQKTNFRISLKLAEQFIKDAGE